MPSACFQRVDKLLLASKHAEGMSLRHGVIVLGDLIQPPLEIILSSGVFRRETASGFYPWGQCGMRSIPRCSKAVFFYVFVFDSNHDSGNNV